MNTKPASPEAAEIGRNIRRERDRLKLTGEDVRRLAGIDPTSLSFFERGIREPNVRHLRRLARAFGVSFDRLTQTRKVRRSRDHS